MDFISELQKKDNKIIVKLTSALTGRMVIKARDHLGLPLSKTSNISLFKFTQSSLLVAQSLLSAPPQQSFSPYASGFFLQGSWGDPSPIDISWGLER